MSEAGFIEDVEKVDEANLEAITTDENLSDKRVSYIILILVVDSGLLMSIQMTRSMRQRSWSRYIKRSSHNARNLNYRFQQLPSNREERLSGQLWSRCIK